jgi:predicted AlkP superfamily phosphohydrolase/phosphomutase|tara:strand:- start:5665 stop:7089 length:1425 start_codon:yes stop_codon:yes gene_type:complete
MGKKVFVLGIDGAMPEKIFVEWLEELPNIKKLMDEGSYARLNSTDPPLSITAWSSITTGKSPTDTGIFEYIYRKEGSYHDVSVMTSRNLKEKQIWEIISEKGLKSVVPYVILTWPLKPFNGCLIAGPQRAEGQNVKCVYPLEMKQEIIDRFGEVPSFDIPRFRNSYEIAKGIKKVDPDKEFVIEECYKIAEKNFRVMEYLIKNKEWNLFFGVIGMTDRMNHMFWKYCDKTHRKYDSDSKYLHTLKEFYIFIDRKIGDLLKLLERDTKIMVLSDHGIMKLNTRVNVTDWLIKEGYMVLKEPIKEKTPFNFSMVDWSKTKAFAIGAYEAQISLNMKGREPEGIIEHHEYDGLIKEISDKLMKVPGDWGEELKTEILFKEKDYDGKFIGEAPDMIVYFDGMQYGSNTTLIGNDTLWSPSTAKGSDDATHSMQGIFIMNDGKNKNGDLGEISYLDVAPTILNLLKIKIPEDMNGKVII